MSAGISLLAERINKDENLVFQKKFSQWLIQLFKMLGQQDEIDTSFCSKNQVRSKFWALDELNKVVRTDHFSFIHIHCGWYGLLATILLSDHSYQNLKIRSFDMDPKANQIADHLNRYWVKNDWQFKAITQNIIDFRGSPFSFSTTNSKGEIAELCEAPQLIINTSCEHLSDFNQWRSLLPENIFVLLQSNNYQEIPEHVNCSPSLDAFVSQSQLRDVLYQGALDCNKYQRFMVIGRT